MRKIFQSRAIRPDSYKELVTDPADDAIIITNEADADTDIPFHRRSHQDKFFTDSFDFFV